MTELRTSIEFSDQEKDLFRQAFAQMQRGGEKAESETRAFEKKWGPDVARDVLPAKPSKDSAKALIQVLQLIPGVTLDQEATQTLERSIFGSSKAMSANLYETNTPGRASEDNSWIEVDTETCEFWGGKRSFVVSVSRVINLDDLTLELEFNEDSISLKGGRIRHLKHDEYPNRNLVQEKGCIQLDAMGNIVDTRGSLANFEGSIELPRLITNITTREGIQQPINPSEAIPVKKSE